MPLPVRPPTPALGLPPCSCCSPCLTTPTAHAQLLSHMEPLLPKNAQVHILSAAFHKQKHLLLQQIRNKFPGKLAWVNTPAYNTFQTFVTADVLVLDLSRYSHLAGLFSDNIKVTSAFRYNTSCDPSWVRATDDGALDTEAFKAALKHRLRMKALRA